MRNVFFYGTLQQTDLLEVVLGRPASMLDMSPAVLDGYRVSSVAEGPFPMIEEVPGHKADGVILRALNDADIARLDFYEGSFAYDLRKVTLESGDVAEVYVPYQGQWTSDGSWVFADWADTWGEVNLIAGQEVMGYYGTRTREEVAKMFPMIRSRAASAVRAKTSRHGRDTFFGSFEVEQRTRQYSKFFALDDVKLRHERFDGSTTPSLDRTVFLGSDAALVLPYDPLRDRVLLVEQIRMGPLLRGDRSVWQLEPIAGRVDAGETPPEAARREALEEAGLQLDQLETIAEAYASPGSSTDFFYMYLGLADLPEGVAGTGGLATEDENIRSHVMSFDALMERVDHLEVANVPLALCAYYLAWHRDRLRSEGAGGTPRL
ncbi:MAG: gamma-glutamylcyclotransferase [Sulfitobacter sp.]